MFPQINSSLQAVRWPCCSVPHGVLSFLLSKKLRQRSVVLFLFIVYYSLFGES